MSNDNQPNLSRRRVLGVEDDAFTQVQIARAVTKLGIADGIGRHSDVNVLGTVPKPVTGPALEEMLGNLWS